MNIFTVSLFGHREIENLRQVEAALSHIIKDLIQTKYYVSFLIGRKGEFDEFAASVIKLAQKELGKENNDITLVLPYKAADIEYYEKYYDNIIIPDILYNVHPKSAITLNNRWMIEHSDLVIVNVEHRSGGAYRAMTYAKKTNKRIINIASEKFVLNNKSRN